MKAGSVAFISLAPVGERVEGVKHPDESRAIQSEMAHLKIQN
jgi:hypothetical protein